MSATMEMTGALTSRAATSLPHIDQVLEKLSAQKKAFARLPIAEKVSLLRACMVTLDAEVDAWVRASLDAKGLRAGVPSESEEWFAGPVTTVRNIRLFAEALEQIARNGKPDLAAPTTTPKGQTVVKVFPHEAAEAAMYGGISAEVRFLDGVTAAQVREKQASFYSKKDPEGGVSVVLGAGNVNSIPPMDALYKMFVEGMVCLVKLNPVNEYLDAIFERAFAPLVKKDYLAFVRGGADVGSYLVQHALVDDVHITGSDRTHDLIVWGATAEEQKRRKDGDDPIFKKPISSELGSVTPVVIVPGPYSDKELGFMAENIATMVVNNGSCNCNAGKMLVTSKAWPQRDALLAKVRAVLADQAPRKAYYPGAFDRFEKLVGHRTDAARLGSAGDGQLPWTLVTNLDAGNKDEALFVTEPFCPILSEVPLDAGDGEKFLKAATAFCNDRLWGTLSAVVFIHPDTQSANAGAFEDMLRDLRYGAVGVNQWTGLVYGLVRTPWGAHPSSTLKDIRGGLGWVHNTFMLEGIEKVVLRGPLTMFPKPPWFVTHRNAHEVAKRVYAMERSPSFLKVPGIALAAMKG